MSPRKASEASNGPPAEPTPASESRSSPAAASSGASSARIADQAVTAFLAGLTAVDGTKRVKAHVRTGALDDWLGDRYHPDFVTVLAIGKAAAAMVWGLVEANVPVRGLGVVPRGTRRPTIDTVRWLVGDHPVPGAGSFAAGKEVLAWADRHPDGEPLLVFLSGGASSVLEAAVDGDEDTLVAAWREDAAAGLPIETLNRRRASRSLLKGGRLGARLLERTDRIRVWLLADTPPGTEAATVGSGPFFQADAPERVLHAVLASNQALLDAAGSALGGAGWQAFRSPHRITGTVEEEVAAFLDAADGLPRDVDVALVGAGEPLVALPADAPAGGRCQHAALVAARHLAARGGQGVFVALASDGVDGTTKEAGAWADGGTWDGGGAAALAAFDAHRFLDRRGQTLRTGPTATNVNDAWFFLHPAGP